MRKLAEEWRPNLLLDHIMAVLGANDQRYGERFAAQEKAVKDALAAQEKAVNAALAASEKAVLVAETNAQKWRDNANEWRDAMTDRERAFAKVEQYQSLKERLDLLAGKEAAHKEVKEDNTAMLAAAIAVVLGVASMLLTLLR